MDINQEQVVEIIVQHLDWFQLLGQEFAKSRFLVCASEYGMNENESAELMRIADGIQIKIQANGTSISLGIEYVDSPYIGIIQEGMEAPVTHGGEETTLPDGSKVPSNAVTNGVELPQYAKEGEDVMGEVKEMMESLFREAINTAAGDASGDIAEIVLKPILAQHIQQEVKS